MRFVYSRSDLSQIGCSICKLRVVILDSLLLLKMDLIRVCGCIVLHTYPCLSVSVATFANLVNWFFYFLLVNILYLPASLEPIALFPNPGFLRLVAVEES